VTTTRAAPEPVAVGWLGAEQLAVVPPPLPVQVQDQGDAEATLDATPTLQRPDDGMNAVVTPLALPQAPFTIAW
jgi:hypothetical protein